MNILNKGRCSRCVASELKTIVKGDKICRWRFCNKNHKWCKGCSSHCSASPMGIKVVEVN